MFNFSRFIFSFFYFFFCSIHFVKMNDDYKKLQEQFDQSIFELNLFLEKLKKEINDINFDNNDVDLLKSLIDEVNSKFLDIKKLKMFEEE